MTCRNWTVKHNSYGGFIIKLNVEGIEVGSFPVIKNPVSRVFYPVAIVRAMLACKRHAKVLR